MSKIPDSIDALKTAVLTYLCDMHNKPLVPGSQAPDPSTSIDSIISKCFVKGTSVEQAYKQLFAFWQKAWIMCSVQAECVTVEEMRKTHWLPCCIDEDRAFETWYTSPERLYTPYRHSSCGTMFPSAFEFVKHAKHCK